MSTQVIQTIVTLCPASIGGLLVAITTMSAVSVADEPETHREDVTDVRIIRRLEQHPSAGKVWQPFIMQGDKNKDLAVAFGAELNGKSDMGDILVSLSNDDGDSWSEPVHVFDHRQRQGAIPLAYANPVLFRAPGQEVIWFNAKSKAYFGRAANGTRIYVYNDAPHNATKHLASQTVDARRFVTKGSRPEVPGARPELIFTLESSPSNHDTE